jgi:glycerol uptake facilitator-like aquaporin
MPMLHVANLPEAKIFPFDRWGIGVMLGIYVAGGAGGHLNPAVTMCMCIYRKCECPFRA